MRLVKYGDVTHACHQRGAGPLAERGEHGIPRLALGGTNLNLDQLMIMQRALRFDDDCVSEPGLPHRYQRMQAVCATPQELALLFG